MKQIFKAIKDLIGSLKTADRHGRDMFWFTSLLSIILAFTGMNIIGGIVLMYLIGIIWEVTYCYVPSKPKKILGVTFNIPMYKDFLTSLKTNPFPKAYHQMGKEDFYYLTGGIVVFILIKVAMLVIDVIRFFS